MWFLTGLFKVELEEMKLFVPLEPNLAGFYNAEKYGPVRHPYYGSPELHLHRVHTVNGVEMNFESWICEVYVPYSDQSCIEDEGQLTRARACISVSAFDNI